MSYIIQNVLLVHADCTQQDEFVSISPHGTVSITSAEDHQLATKETFNSKTFDSMGSSKPSMRRKKFQQKQNNNYNEQPHIEQDYNSNEQSHTRQSNISNEQQLYYEQETSALSTTKIDSAQRLGFSDKSGLPNIDVEGSKMFNIVSPSEEEVRTVKESFYQSMDTYNEIIQIDGIRNDTMKEQYNFMKECIEANNPEKEVERHLWHGTAVQHTPHGLMPLVSICSKGFNRNYSGTATGNVYGDGVYFALKATVSAKYSAPDMNGYSYMFYCSVLVGDYTAGRNGLKTTPAKNNETQEWYDSVCDNCQCPSMFVIFNDVAAYPTYLIIFRQQSERVADYFCWWKPRKSDSSCKELDYDQKYDLSNPLIESEEGICLRTSGADEGSCKAYNQIKFETSKRTTSLSNSCNTQYDQEVSGSYSSDENSHLYGASERPPSIEEENEANGRMKKQKTSGKLRAKHVVICILCILYSILGFSVAILSLIGIDWSTRVEDTLFGTALCFTGFTSCLCMFNVRIIMSLNSIAWLNYVICWVTIQLLSNIALVAVTITHGAYSSRYALLTPLAWINNLTVASCIGLTILFLRVKPSKVVIVDIVLHMLVGLIGLSLVVLSELCTLDLLPHNCLSEITLQIIFDLLRK